MLGRAGSANSLYNTFYLKVFIWSRLTSLLNILTLVLVEL